MKSKYSREIPKLPNICRKFTRCCILINFLVPFCKKCCDHILGMEMGWKIQYPFVADIEYCQKRKHRNISVVNLLLF